jgi:hypothetical protein
MQPYRNEDPSAPQNPPNSVVNRRVRTNVVWWTIGPLALATLIIGAMAVFEPAGPIDVRTEADQARAIGTAGMRTPGGHNPDPVPDTASQEREWRGGDTFVELAQIMKASPSQDAGRRVRLTGVTVSSVSHRDAQLQEGGATITMAMPSRLLVVKPGQKVDVEGTLESDERGGLRIRASRVVVQQ